MDAEEYVKGRLEPQIDWYDEKSARNKGTVLSFRVVEIVCAAMIPLLSVYLENAVLRFTTGLLAAVIVVCVGVVALFQFQERWVTYRSAAEGLKKEKFLFLTRVEPYNTDKPFQVLVHRVETLISQENLNWIQSTAKLKEGENRG